MERWPHQIQAVNDVHAARDAGERIIILTSPTGGGKSVMMSDLISAALERQEKAILYTNRKMLTEQTVKVMNRQGIKHGVRAAGWETDFGEDLQIASIQTEHSKTKRMQRDLHDADLVLVDEFHLNKGPLAQLIYQKHLNQGACIVGVTATPVEMGSICGIEPKLIVAGTTSQLRACGALVPAAHYGVSEPDTRKVRKALWEYTEADVRKLMMVQGIFGIVLAEWRRLNPDALPTLLFAPGVAESIWFAEQFRAAGVKAAHIDGKDCWIDGEFYKSDRDIREKIVDGSRRGEITVICNRFVLREGLDLPWLQCGIFATVFSTIQAYIQSGGRLLRAHPGKKEACISSGTPILTNHGLKPIQDVTVNDLLWDGISWVSHHGAICNGTMEVIQWDGLTATPNHKVHTNHGWKTLEEASVNGWRLTKTGICGEPVRVSDDSDPHDQKHGPESRSGSFLPKMRETVICEVSQDREEGAKRVPNLHQAFRGEVPGVDLQEGSAPMEEMQRPLQCCVQELRRKRNQILLPFSVGCNMLDSRKSWRSEQQEPDSGQNRQQWTLRARKHAMVGQEGAVIKSEEMDSPELQIEEIPSGIPVCQVQQELHRCHVSQRDGGRENCRTMAEVWDIVNAGPRHRFTASGSLVGNCIIDHGGNWHKLGSLNADRNWALDYKLREGQIQGMRVERMRERSEVEPFICPRCKRVLTRSECPCGFKVTRRTRPVLQADGRLREMEGTIYNERKVDVKSNTLKIWESCYFRSKHSKRRMTFNQAVGLFFYENHYWPPRDLPLMPREKLDWYLPVCEVPKERLVSY